MTLRFIKVLLKFKTLSEMVVSVTAQKMRFRLRISLLNLKNLFLFTKEFYRGKLYLSCSLSFLVLILIATLVNFRLFL